jgi:anti-sigma factor RsiW
MCEFYGKLIAWLDNELPAEEAASVERHLEACSECRSRIDAYRLVSSEFEAYCDETIASSAPREIPRWVPAVSAVGAVAALVALFLVWPRTRIDGPAFHPPQPAVVASSALVPNRMPAPVYPVQREHRRQAITRVQIQNANAAPTSGQNAYFLPEEPVIEIAIPADEIFPPGAVPEGMHFAADLAIAADGSAGGLRLRPRLAGFERRTTQP